MQFESQRKVRQPDWVRVEARAEVQAAVQARVQARVHVQVAVGVEARVEVQVWAPSHQHQSGRARIRLSSLLVPKETPSDTVETWFVRRAGLHPDNATLPPEILRAHRMAWQRNSAGYCCSLESPPGGCLKM